MSYAVHPQEYSAVTALAASQRYQYLLAKVADWQEIWSVGNEKGWSLMTDDTGTEMVPIWPAEKFAAECCVGDWHDCQPRAIGLDEWLAKWLPGIERDARQLAVFPTRDNRGAVLAASRFAQDIAAYLSAYD